MSIHDVAIELTDEAKELLVEKGYDPAMGARPLRRAIQRVIEDPLADFVLGRTLEPGSTILVSRKGETEEVDMTVIPGEVTPEKVTVPPEEPVASGADDVRLARRLVGFAGVKPISSPAELTPRQLRLASSCCDGLARGCPGCVPMIGLAPRGNGATCRPQGTSRVQRRRASLGRSIRSLPQCASQARARDKCRMRGHRR